MIGFTTPSVLSGYTVANLINSLPPNSGITYADVLALLLNPGDLSWETLDLTGTPIQNFSTGGSTLGYQADFHLAPNGGPVGVPNTATLDVKLPPGFVYQPGSTAASGQRRPGAEPARQPDACSRRDAPLDGQRQRRHELQPPVHDPARADARPDRRDRDDHARRRRRRAGAGARSGHRRRHARAERHAGGGAVDLDRRPTARATRSTSRT